jgi:hypothetical protein
MLSVRHLPAMLSVLPMSPMSASLPLGARMLYGALMFPVLKLRVMSSLRLLPCCPRAQGIWVCVFRALCAFACCAAARPHARRPGHIGVRCAGRVRMTCARDDTRGVCAYGGVRIDGVSDGGDSGVGGACGAGSVRLVGVVVANGVGDVRGSCGARMTMVGTCCVSCAGYGMRVCLPMLLPAVLELYV